MVSSNESSGRTFDKLFALLVVLTALVCGMLFASFPGTTDVAEFWLPWVKLLREYGLADGYLKAAGDYPPGSFLILCWVGKIAGILAVSDFAILKATIVLFALGSTLIFWRWSRNFWLTLGFAFAIMLNSASHAYLDVLYLPFLLLSLWGLQKQRYMLCSLFFTLAVFIKWQPILLAPFLIAHACWLHRGGSLPNQRRFDILGRMVLTALPVVVIACLLVRPSEIYAAFNRATDHHVASYQGLNLNWIAQYIHYQQAGLAGSGKKFFEQKIPALMLDLPKYAFLGLFSVAFLIQIFRSRDARFVRCLWFALTGFLTYCVVNKGVHENHFFVPMILAFVIAASSPSSNLGLVVFAALAANLNLFIFYGQDGQASLLLAPFTSSIVNGVTLALAALNTAFLVLCWIRCVRDDFHSEAKDIVPA